MRRRGEILEDIERVSVDLRQHERTGELLRGQLAHLFLQARQHPGVCMEDARRIPDPAISRQSAYELAKAAER